MAQSQTILAPSPRGRRATISDAHVVCWFTNTTTRLCNRRSPGPRSRELRTFCPEKTASQGTANLDLGIRSKRGDRSRSHPRTLIVRSEASSEKGSVLVTRLFAHQRRARRVRYTYDELTEAAFCARLALRGINNLAVLHAGQWFKSRPGHQLSLNNLKAVR